jgi:anti-sigma regulatory factor (Ser/Thr protein kinase)
VPSAVQHRLKHDAIFHSDDAALARAAVAFVREGVGRDEVVMVNTGASPVTALLSALFQGEEQVSFADQDVYRTPAAALDNYLRTMERGLADGATGFRAMGYLDFEASQVPWQEWLRYEAAVNRVFADFPLHTLCPYDTSRVPAEITDAIRRAHPGLVDETGWGANPDYVEPELLVTDESLRTPPHPLQTSPPRMELEPTDDQTELRMEIYSATLFTSLDRARIDDFVTAVGEVVMNAYKHGGTPVALRLWAADAAVVCSVTDQGAGIADPFVGYVRPRHPAEGLGLWATRQLVDVLDYGHGPDGFSVRLASFL